MLLYMLCGFSPYYIYILFKKYSKEIVAINSVPIISGIGNFITSKKVNMKGLKSGETLEKAYNQIAEKRGIKKLTDISMPLVIPTVDIMDSKEYVFTNYIPKEAKDTTQYITDITLGKAVRASSSFPAVFSPCEYGTHRFMDGGALDNIPVHEVKKQGADKVMAVKFDADKVDENSNIMDIAMKTIDIMGSKIAEENLEMSDFVLNVYTDKVGLLDTNKLDSCYQCGYNAVIENLDKIKKMYNEV